MHKFIITGLVMTVFLTILLSGLSFVFNPGMPAEGVLSLLIPFLLISGIISFLGSIIFHLLMTVLKHRNETFESLGKHLMTGFLLGLFFGIIFALISGSHTFIKFTGSALVLLFYPIMGILISFVYYKVKD